MARRGFKKQELMMKFFEVEQGSGDWFRLRSGKPSASQFHRIITPAKAEKSKQADDYLYQLIAERLLGEPVQSFNETEEMIRGKALEPDACSQYELVTETLLSPGGLVMDDDKLSCASPDRLFRTKSGSLCGLEVKCPMAKTMVRYHLVGLGNDYRPQVQGQIMLGEFDHVHFYAYHPRMPAYEVITHPDEAFIKLLRVELAEFNERLDEAESEMRKLGAYVETTYSVTPLDVAYPDRSEALRIIVP
jgi:hypothetical protein